jgi:hypothetical protein
MRTTFTASRLAFVVALLWLTTIAPAAGQGAGNAIPRTPDGKPDLSGIWQTMNSAAWNVEDHSASAGVPAGQGVVDGGTIPYLPAAVARRNDNFAQRATADPESKCYLLGVPRIMYAGFPFQIVQQAAQVTMLFEYAHATRYVYTNGSQHPPGHIDWWMGDSRGRWEGDTLVVDVVHFGPETWLDRAGNHHSEALHVVERFTPLDADHITYQVTLEDPNVFARPWTMSMILYRHRERNAQLLEYECVGFEFEKIYPYPELNR